MKGPANGIGNQEVITKLSQHLGVSIHLRAKGCRADKTWGTVTITACGSSRSSDSIVLDHESPCFAVAHASV